MGNNHAQKYQISHSKEIDEEIKLDEVKLAKEIKILLLGTSESGKSTIANQLKIIHKQSFTREERIKYKYIVIGNTIQALKAMLRAMNKLNVALDDTEKSKNVTRFFELANHFKYTRLFNDELSELMKKLWLNNSVQTYFARSCEYFLDSGP